MLLKMSAPLLKARSKVKHQVITFLLGSKAIVKKQALLALNREATQ